jgi:6-phosphogluconolactonase
VLSNLSASPVPISALGIQSEAIVLDPSGKFLFTATLDSRSWRIYAFTRDLTSGNVTPAATSPFAGRCVDHAPGVDPAGKFLIAVSSGQSTLFGTISVYTLDSTSGALALVVAPAHTGTDPSSVTVEPSGQYVYVSDEADTTLSAFLISSPTALTPVAGSPFPSGGHGTMNGPSGIFANPCGRFVYVCNASNDISAFKINAVSGALTAVAAPHSRTVATERTGL